MVSYDSPRYTAVVRLKKRIPVQNRSKVQRATEGLRPAGVGFDHSVMVRRYTKIIGETAQLEICFSRLTGQDKRRKEDEDDGCHQRHLPGSKALQNGREPYKFHIN